jgi:GH24 family phage-related lysozyme (muramidase)
MTQNKIRLLDLFKYYKSLPHQSAALAELEEYINRANPHILARDQAWFKTWTQGGKQNNYDAAVKLIKEFEGCHLSAYPDPLHGWDVATIGYGTTRYPDGRKVQKGDKITVLDATDLLEIEVDRIVEKLRGSIPFWNAMSANKQCALVSFAYNLGASFYASAGFETISKRLKDKDWDRVPAAMELYRNPGSNVEAGLLRRRRAEGMLWAQNKESGPGEVLLRVAYEAQNDNASGTGYRECFSSSAAMVARFYGKVNNDDEYNRIRSVYGDTTDVQAQIKALQSLNLQARFVTNCNAARLEAEINAGRPVMTGWLHKGPINNPSGGGHWSVVIGYTESSFTHNDPNGEADLVNGGYVNHANGMEIKYSKKNWVRRWEVDGPNTGWAVLVSRG